MQTKLEISQYREALRTACQSVHDLSHKAHEPGMKHLYEAARLLDQRCDSVARLANSQLRAMGSNNQWIKAQMGVNHNPFAADRRKHAERGTTTRSAEPNLKKNKIRKDKKKPAPAPGAERDERSIRVTGVDIPKFVQLRTDSVLPYWPSFMDEEYVAYADRLRLEGEVCSSTDMFFNPEAVVLADMGCDVVVLPEIYDEGSPYYNPLFVGSLNMTEFRLTSRLEMLREVYMSHDPIVRERRQIITGLSIAGGMAFGGAISRVLKWFGYSPTTDIDVRHINLNQKHIMMVVEQLNKTQTYANKIMDDSHTLERKEFITESYIQMETAIQGIMDSYCLLYTSPSPRDLSTSRMPSSA